jgi:bacterial/archaeal transporter family-2 protein
MTNLYMLVAVVVGSLTVVQVLVNTQLRIATMSVLWAAFVQFFVGASVLALLALQLREPFPLAGLPRSPWWIWSGGLIGAVYIVLSIFLLPRIGAALLFASIIVGQLAGSILIDHYGWLGAPIQRLSLARVAGAALLVVGAALIRWR